MILFAQDEFSPVTDNLPKAPRVSTVGTLPLGAPEAPGLGVDRGIPHIEPASFRPGPLLPQRPVYTPGKFTDERVTEASGDPFFLGFSGGPYHPPEGERVDPDLVTRVFAGSEDGRPEAVVYGYAMLNERVSPERIEQLLQAGARVIAYRPQQVLSVAVDFESMSILADHPAVRWLGFARPWQKLHPHLVETLAETTDGQRASLVVSVFDDDRGPFAEVEALAPTELAGPGLRRTEEARGEKWRSGGWQEAVLESLGAEVGEYLPNIRAFRLEIDPERIGSLIELDFVEFIEPDLPSMAMHDDSMPMIAADFVRATYDGGWSGQAIAGEIDSGIDVGHTMLNHGHYLGWTLTGNSSWTDTCPHGTHVAGTILGVPAGGFDELTSAAPGLGGSWDRSFRNVKFMEQNPNPLGNNCISTGGSSLEQRFSLMRDTWTDGQIVSPAPHVVNNSWGTGPTTGGWDGTEANAREVDAEVWNENQVYVFSSGNFGPAASTLSQEASAKNGVTVGNVVPYDSNTAGPPGSLWIGTSGSSIGPTGDNRWKPNLVAPGRSVVSATAHTGDGTNPGSGTSMAAPHVTGAIAQMVDRYAWLRYEPARIASLAMAMAMPKADETLSTSGEVHLDTYGAGRMDAYRAVYTDSQHGWLNWGFDLGSGQQTYDEFEVSSNVERLVVVMHYIEPAASGGASAALVNDFDLVLDYAPFSAAIDEGNYLAHQSSVNNTEIRTINNPTSGSWRWKVHPVSASTSVNMSVTVHFIYGDTSPAGSLSVGADDVFVQPGEDVVVTASVGNTEHVISGGLVEVTAAGGANLLESTMELLDGAMADLTDNSFTNGGWEATVGNVRHGWTRDVDWTVDWNTEGVKTFTVDADSDNGMDRTASVTVTVDGTGPGVAGSLQSSSHFPNQWSNDPEVHFVWSHAPDNLSGLAGYGVFVATGPSNPAAVIDLPVTTLTSETLSSSASGWTFNLRAVDQSGNWSSNYASTGPYLIDTVDPETVTGLVSTSHLSGLWSNDPTVDVQWFPATDAHSGVAGYGVFWSNSIPNAPSFVQDLGNVTTDTSEPIESATFPRWFNIRTLDEAGNWDSHYTSAGPFWIDVDAPVVAPPTFAVGGAVVTETTVGTIEVRTEASDLHSGLAEMRLRNADAGFFGPWIPYEPVVSWNLFDFGAPKGTGTKTVEVEVRDGAGNVTSVAESVYYYDPAVSFGSACKGNLGLPGIETKGLVSQGSGFAVTVSNTDATLRRLVLGTSMEKWGDFALPFDLGGFGAPGCDLLVSQDLTLYSGSGSVVELTVPDNAGLVGAEFFLQWLLFGDSSGAPVVTSAALEVTVNGV